MPKTFRAYQITKDEQGTKAALRQLTELDLMDGDVTVKVEYSSLNYKDALALTFRAPIARRFPLIPGIDFAGVVTATSNAAFKVGDKVLLTGFGVGEVHNGGFSEMARVPAEWLLPLPSGLDTRQAMVVGTAGFTAMLCVLVLEKHGITPDDGDLLVTGAAGGVGSVAVAILAKLGYRVVASTGRAQEKGFLQALGASDVIDRATFAGKGRPLAHEKWAGAIDVAGGHTLANVLSQIKRGGAVAACGLAESMDLPASVAPFILRGITLYGIDSVMVPMELRRKAWQRIVQDLDLDRFVQLANEITLDELPSAAEAILAGKIRGRTVIRMS